MLGTEDTTQAPKKEFVSCLDQRPPDPFKLITSDFLIQGTPAKGVIDCGATRTFIPSDGKIMKNTLLQRLPIRNTRVHAYTADNKLVRINSAIDVHIKPVGSTKPPTQTEMLIVDSLQSDLLGADLIVGIPLLHKLQGTIDFSKLPISVKWAHDPPPQEPPQATIALLPTLNDKLEAPVPSPSSGDGELQSIISRYAIFAEELNGSIIDRAAVRINLSHNIPIAARPKRHTVDEAHEIKQHIIKYRRQGIIQPSNSEYASNCRLVPKRNGSKRLVINFIPLNRATLRDVYPTPLPDNMFQYLQGAKYFSTLDATEGFYQLELHPDDRHLTAFVTHDGFHEFTRCPFGLTNAPAEFQRAMNDIFDSGLGTKCLVYIDDIIVFGKTKQEHHHNLEWTLRQCERHNLKIKYSKCNFFKASVRFLGRQISAEGIAPIVDNLDFLDHKPTDAKELRSLLGHLVFLARFIPRYSEISKDLYELLTKNSDFLWTLKHEAALKQIREELMNARPQLLPTRNSPKVVEIVALQATIEAICLNDNGNLIERASRILSQSEQNYTTIEKNLLTIILAYEKFPYLSDDHTTFVTDSKELIRILHLSNFPKRVENLLLRLPPGTVPNLKLRQHSVVHEVAKHKHSPDPSDATIYTDGACSANGKPECKASWAIYVPDHPHLSASGLVTERPSNQTAELTAAAEACRLAKTQGWSKITIVSDSKYLINAVTSWSDRWAETGFKDCRGKPVTNQNLIKQLVDIKQGLDIQWIYTRGHSDDPGNMEADRMARAVLETPISQMASFKHIDLQDQKLDPEIDTIIKNIGELSGKFIVEDNALYHLDGDPSQPATQRLVVPTSQRHLLMKLAHDDQLYGGHLGNRKTQRKLRDYWWPGMAKDVTAYVQSCETCQQFKHQKGRPPGLLHTVPISRLFERLHVDVVGPLNPRAISGARYILTAIDAFTRYAYAEAKPEVRTEDVLEFIKDIVAVHGTPECIISDKGAQFTSHKYLQMCKDFGIDHRFTTPYHPRTNGMDERWNATLVRILRSYVNNHQSRWDGHLLWAVYVYNTTHQESIGYSPHEAMFGYKPRNPLNLKPKNTLSIQEARARIRDTVYMNDRCSRDAQKRYHDRSHAPAKFTVGQPVLLRRHTVPSAEIPKFSRKWDGPAIIIKLPTSTETGEPKFAVVLDVEHAKCRSVAIQDLKPFNTREDYPRPIKQTINEVHALQQTLQAPNNGSNIINTTHTPIPPPTEPTRVTIDIEDDPNTARTKTAGSRRKQTLPIINNPRLLVNTPQILTTDGDRDWLYPRPPNLESPSPLTPCTSSTLQPPSPPLVAEPTPPYSNRPRRLRARTSINKPQRFLVFRSLTSPPFPHKKGGL